MLRLNMLAVLKKSFLFNFNLTMVTMTPQLLLSFWTGRCMTAPFSFMSTQSVLLWDTLLILK